METLYHFSVINDYERLDVALQEILRASRSQTSQWIEKKLVFINEKMAKKSRPLKKCDAIRIFYIPVKNTHETKNTLQNLHIEVIHEENDYLILNKPRNLVVHHAPSVKDITLTDYLLQNNYELSTLNGESRFGIVHRLDKDTSGAILIAKNNGSHLKFSEMLKNRTMGRIYICIINKPLKEDCFVECFMGRNPANRLKMAKLDKIKFPQARDSKSQFKKIMISKNGMFELIGVRLYSGRTHQIRVHLSTLDRYIYGDTLYSPDKLSAKYTTKMLLHAQLLYFEGRVFSAKIPKDLVKFLEQNFIDHENTIESFLNKWQQELKVSKS